MLEEVFVETCWEDEAIVRQRRDDRRAKLEALGMKCRSEDCYRITDWRRVYVLIAETPEIEPVPVLREKKVVTVDRLPLRDGAQRQSDRSAASLRVPQTASDKLLSSSPDTKLHPVKRRTAQFERR